MIQWCKQISSEEEVFTSQVLVSAAAVEMLHSCFTYIVIKKAGTDADKLYRSFIKSSMIKVYVCSPAGGPVSCSKLYIVYHIEMIVLIYVSCFYGIYSFH